LITQLLGIGEQETVMPIMSSCRHRLYFDSSAAFLLSWWQYKKGWYCVWLQCFTFN